MEYFQSAGQKAGNERSPPWPALPAFSLSEGSPTPPAVTLTYPHPVSSLDFPRTPLLECKEPVGSGYQQLCKDWLPHSSFSLGSPELSPQRACRVMQTPWLEGAGSKNLRSLLLFFSY